MSQTKCFTWRTSGEHWDLSVWYTRKQLGGALQEWLWPLVAGFHSSAGKALLREEAVSGATHSVVCWLAQRPDQITTTHERFDI